MVIGSEIDILVLVGFKYRVSVNRYHAVGKLAVNKFYFTLFRVGIF